MTEHPPSSPSPARVAMLSMHTSPLDTPGVGDAGGLNVYVAELAHQLAARGVEVDVFTRRRDEQAPEVTRIDTGYRVIQVPAGPVGPVPKEELPRLTDEFADNLLDRYPNPGWDVLHGHYWLSGMAGLRIADRIGVPLVQTMHTSARAKNLNRADNHLTEPSIRSDGETKIISQAAILTANTPEEADELSRLYGARVDQLAIVPPGVDLETFHPCDQIQSRELHGIGLDDKIILFVGRLQPLKAPDVLIDAVAVLINRRPELRERLKLIIIGSPSGPQSTWADALPDAIRDHGLDDQIIVRPHSPRPELFRWYCTADIVGVPSYNESFGLVALEAEACGRAGGGHRRRRAATCGTQRRDRAARRRSSARTMGRRTGALLDDPDRARQLGQAGARHAAQFSWDNTAEASLAAYARAMTRR